jgi:hypothetical protein
MVTNAPLQFPQSPLTGKLISRITAPMAALDARPIREYIGYQQEENKVD